MSWVENFECDKSDLIAQKNEESTIMNIIHRPTSVSDTLTPTHTRAQQQQVDRNKNRNRIGERHGDIETTPQKTAAKLNGCLQMSFDIQRKVSVNSSAHTRKQHTHQTATCIE